MGRNCDGTGPSERRGPSPARLDQVVELAICPRKFIKPDVRTMSAMFGLAGGVVPIRDQGEFPNEYFEALCFLRDKQIEQENDMIARANR